MSARRSAMIAAVVRSFSLFSLLILLYFSSCKNGGVDPPAPNKDPRTYTWQRDTLGDGSYQSDAFRLWASGPRDVYAVGHGSSLFIGKIWHFDGKSWTDITPKYVEAFPGQQIFSFSLTDVFGFGTNDVWVVGYRDTSAAPQNPKQGLVMHYNGVQWSGGTIPGGKNFLTVWGTSSRDLWTGDAYGSVFHHDGTNWQQFALKDSLIVIQIRGAASTDVYASGWITNDGTGIPRIMYYQWKGSSWSLVESRRETDPLPGFSPRFTMSGGRMFSYYASAVSERKAQGSWQDVLNDPAANFRNIHSVGSTDIYALGGTDGEVLYHLNGKDWYRFPQFKNSNIILAFMWANDEEAFISCEELNGGTAWPRSFVLHGK